MRTAVLLAALLATAAAAQPFQRMAGAAACRQDITRLCGDARGDREAMRACLIEKRAELSADCRDMLAERMRDRMGARRQQDAAALPASRTVAYGSAPEQAADVYGAAAGGRKPLVVFVHGGGWARGDRKQSVGAKAGHFTASGYVFASTGYRLVPEATVEQQAADVAAAIAALRKDAGRLGVDPDRIALVGHSAGAHLAALVATDTGYLGKAGVPIGAIRGVVLLDGAGYDIPAQMATLEGRTGPLAKLYGAAFGSDPVRQRALSPTAKAGAPNAGAFLIEHVASRDDSRAQSEWLAAALKAAGTAAEVVAVEGNHMTINRELGRDGDANTRTVDAFLRRVF